MTDQRSVDEVQREVERDRARLRSTADAILDGLSPGQLFARAVDYLWEEPRGGGQSRLVRAIVENPLPVLVIGAGLAWLAVAASQPRRRR